MKSRKTPTELELHRLKFHSKGKKSRRVSLDSLDDGDKKLFADDVFTRVYSEKKEPYSAYAEALDDWGVSCPHPQHLRSYDGKLSQIPIVDVKWYNCSLCECSVFNEDFEDSKLNKAV